MIEEEDAVVDTRTDMCPSPIGHGVGVSERRDITPDIRDDLLSGGN